MKTLVKYVGISFGSDPELFLSKGGKIIGSEKIIPENGLLEHSMSISPVVIRDGVQVELNVPAHSCRQSFSNNLSRCFRLLDSELAKHKGTLNRRRIIKPDFSQTVEVGVDEMRSLHPSSQQFGCAPSENAYGKQEISITDASNYFFRSAGGHIHMGINSEYLKDAATMVKIMDILLGNTCVLLDRDAGNIERRKVYGKAGEYRLPRHGLEYRVLSNFWLRSYQVMSFVLSVARFSVAVANNPEATKKLLQLVDIDKVRYAIDNNDYDVALDNFNDIKDYVRDIVAYIPEDREYDPNRDNTYPLEGNRMDQFVYFMEKGLDHWFTEDIMQHWIDHNYPNRRGWESFLTVDVARQMQSQEEKLVLEVA